MISDNKALLHKFLSNIKYRLSVAVPPKLYWHLMGQFKAVPAVTSEFNQIEDCLDSGKKVVDLMEKLGVVAPNFTTLQIGSGLGRVEMHLCQKVSYCYGVDISPTMVTKAKEFVKVPNVEFICNDGKGLSDFPDSSLDLIYSFLVFQHLPREQVSLYIQEAFRKLKVSGCLVFQIMIDELGVMAEPQSQHPYGLRYYKRKEIEKMILDTGFDKAAFFQVENGDVDGGESMTSIVCVTRKK